MYATVNSTDSNKAQPLLTSRNEYVFSGSNSVTVNTPVTLSSGDVMTIDDAAFLIIDTVINCFVIHVIAIFGMCGNVITLVVLACHDVKRDTTNIFLMSLTCFDLLFCVSIPFRRINCILGYYNQAYGVTSETLSIAYVFVFNRSMTNGEIWLVSAISVERLAAVWLPFKVARIFTPFRVKCIVVAVVLLTLVVMSPAVFTFTYEWVHDPALNATVAKLLLTDFYRANYDAVNFVCYVVYNIVLNGIPWLLVVFCGVSTGIKVVHTGNLRKRLVQVSGRNGKTPTGSKKSRKDNAKDNASLDLRVVKMLGLVCFFSAIVFVPTMLLDVYSYYVPNFIYQSKLYSALVICIDLLYTLNASGNFLIYASVSNKFSKTYLAIFRHCRVMN